MGDFWKPTSEMFSGLIERPKMTEKLLLKPPFKYLFDIIMETIKKTGCGNGNPPPMQASTLAKNSMPTSTQTGIKKSAIFKRPSN
jgi:hypothetical protein